jgi:hypothetical protein
MRAAYEAVACDYPKSVFPFMPFQPRWAQGLELQEKSVFSALLELSWCMLPPCYLPGDPDKLRKLLVERYNHPSWDEPVPPRVLWRFCTDSKTGFLYFPPLLHAYRYMVRAEHPDDVLQISLM